MRKLEQSNVRMRTTLRAGWTFLLWVLFIGAACNATESRAENNTDQPVFSYLLGIQQPHAVESGLALHEGVPSQLWCADHIVNSMGGDILKLTMSRKYLKMQNLDPQGAEYLVEFAKHPFYQKILNLPYRVMYFWAHAAILKRSMKMSCIKNSTTSPHICSRNITTAARRL